jgi:hypothetical protein
MARLFAAAVSAVIPPAYGPAYELAVNRLTLAAADQAQLGRETAGAVALGTILVGAVLVLATRGNG